MTSQSSQNQNGKTSVTDADIAALSETIKAVEWHANYLRQTLISAETMKTGFERLNSAIRSHPTTYGNWIYPNSVGTNNTPEESQSEGQK